MVYSCYSYRDLRILGIQVSSLKMLVIPSVRHLVIYSVVNFFPPHPNSFLFASRVPYLTAALTVVTTFFFFFLFFSVPLLFPL